MKKHSINKLKTILETMVNKQLNENMVGHINKKGTDTYVDSNFINLCKGVLPNSELKHMGFGEFYLQTPEGDIQFARTSEQMNGFVGRSHKIYDDVDGKLVSKLIDKMLQTNKAEMLRETLTQSRKKINNESYLKLENYINKVVESTLNETPIFERKYKYIIVDPDNSGGRIKISGTALSSGSISPHDKYSVLRILQMKGVNAKSYRVIETGPQINESKLNENPVPLTRPTKPAPTSVPPAPAAKPKPAPPVETGIDPAWKLDMVEFLGNSFAGMAKQFLYQAKKSNPKATPEQISALADDMLDKGQIVELFKTRFVSSIKAAL